MALPRHLCSAWEPAARQPRRLGLRRQPAARQAQQGPPPRRLGLGRHLQAASASAAPQRQAAAAALPLAVLRRLAALRRLGPHHLQPLLPLALQRRRRPAVAQRHRRQPPLQPSPRPPPRSRPCPAWRRRQSLKSCSPRLRRRLQRRLQERLQLPRQRKPSPQHRRPRPKRLWTRHGPSWRVGSAAGQGATLGPAGEARSACSARPLLTWRPFPLLPLHRCLPSLPHRSRGPGGGRNGG